VRRLTLAAALAALTACARPATLPKGPVAAAAGMFLVLPGGQRFKRRRETVSSASQPTTPTAPMPQAAERWQVELHDFTREAEARLDTKLAALQRLILQADERIAHLESLGLDAPAPSSVEREARPASPAAGPHFATSETTPPAQARAAAIYAMADAGNNAATIANRLGSPIAEVELILSLRRTQRS